MNQYEISATIVGDKTYTYWEDDVFHVVGQSYIDMLKEHYEEDDNKSRYYDIIHNIDELWEVEWDWTDAAE